jgi:hypothetical protein
MIDGGIYIHIHVVRICMRVVCCVSFLVEEWMIDIAREKLIRNGKPKKI